MNALFQLRKFAAGGRAEERCALCAAPLQARHPHVVQTDPGKLLCSCAVCVVLFDHESGKFRRVPDRVTRLGEFRMSDEQWRAFGIPVDLAFFQMRSSLGRVLAIYPSPLGAVESSVPIEAWESILQNDPTLRTLEPDVEGFLVRRAGPRKEYFIAPLDECYGLIGLMRREWKGFSGGDEVRHAVERFFEDLRTRSGDRT